MSDVNNRNATASWSGFSHQGQVGILIALRELQKEDVDQNNTFIQFEKCEDVAIYTEVDEDIEYLSVHQVKAYYSDRSNFKSKYSPVLNGVFQLGNENYLHTVVEIDDWDTSLMENKNNINRYKYSNDNFHCGTTEIESHIKNELAKIIGENDGKIECAVKRLTYQLDLKIRGEHQKKKKELFDVKFSLSEIKQFVLDESEFNSKEIFDCRKLFYDLYIEALKKSSLTEAELKNIEKLIDEIYHTFSDDEFFMFTQRLSLSRSPNHLNLTQSTFNEDGLKQVFFKLLMNISNVYPDVKKEDLTVLYNKFRYVLTTIIDEQDDAKKVVQNILMNLDSQRLLWESTSIINKEINGAFQDILPEYFDIRGKEEKAEDFKGFMQYNGSTSFICRDTAKIKLTDGDTN